MNAQFAETVFHARHRVFGYRLRPFSAAHITTLEAAGSPLTKGHRSATADDLLLAAKICAAPVRLVEGVYLPAVKWRASLRDQYRLAVRSVSKKRIAREVAAWAAYLGDYLDTPALMATPNKQPRPLSSPAVMAAAIAGSKLFGEARAWSMPFGLLRTCLQVRGEMEGAEIRFAPSKEEVERIKAEFAEADKAGEEILRRIQKGEIHLSRP